MTSIENKLTLIEFNNLTSKEKEIYWRQLLELPIEFRDSVDIHILKFYYPEIQPVEDFNEVIDIYY